jgi:hypothetical protein
MWRNCEDGQIFNTTPPDNWIDVPYTGQGGGTCYEPVKLEFSETKLEFQKTNFSNIPFATKTVTVRNTSTTASYRVNLATDDRLFTLSTTQLTILPGTTQNFTVEIPITKEQNFAIGKTVVRLQVSVTKL